MSAKTVTANEAVPTKHPVHEKLGQMFATAICGNDILSSALYVSGIAIVFGGVYAPLVLAAVCLVLFFYKSVYTEVVEALPLNGGAYNCLLNGTSKIVAAVAGVMTILSYVATAVISAKSGLEYLHTIVDIPVIPATIALLGFFAILVIGGLKDSAKVAFTIFATHILVLTIFVVIGFMFIFKGSGGHFMENITKTGEIVSHQGGILRTFFLAFSASLLGVSGFESSANFVEEQKKGVFRKTLRNMLIGVAVFNPLMAFVVLNVLPYDVIVSSKDFLIADAAKILGGSILQYIVVINALAVLSGAVLTAFIGVSGLINRMAGDSCLPSFLNKENKKGSFPRIVIGFFLLCSSILIITQGDLLSLAGVYTISFLGVMCLFALGNFILKETRTDLKRTYRAPAIFVFLAFFSTFMGMIGNIVIDHKNLEFFAVYFIPAFIIVLLFVFQDYFFKFLMRITKDIPFIQTFLNKNFQDIIAGSYIAFVHNISRLHSLLSYLDRNETSRNLILVCCIDGKNKEDDENYRNIKEALPILQKAGVYSHIRVSVVAKKSNFGPEVIDEVSNEFNIRKNRILIGSIHDFHNFDYDQLGGVRIVF